MHKREDDKPDWVIFETVLDAIIVWVFRILAAALGICILLFWLRAIGA